MLRCFWAIPLPKTVTEEMARLQRGLKAAGIRASWNRTEQAHLTLAFLGNQMAERIPFIAQAGRRAAEGVSPFELRLGDLGAFPKPSRPQVLWLGLETSQALALLAERLAQQLEDLGIAREKRAFAPHLTLARLKDPSPPLGDLLQKLNPESLSFPVDSLILYQSELHPGGAEHKPLAVMPLV